MNRSDQIGAVQDGRPTKLRPFERVCPECAERSCLRELVAELLYKNQILRFELQGALEQLMSAALPPEMWEI